MSTEHGGPVTLKPIGEVAVFLKNQIPARIPEVYALKSMFKSVASEENIRRGVIAFRDFLYTLCDRLISDGDQYAKPPKKPANMADYPFLPYLTNLLVDMGYHGKLSENGDSLRIEEIPAFTASIDEKGKKTPPKIPFFCQIECLRFLAFCGFAFAGVDLEAKTLSISEEHVLEVSYPSNPILLTGLKALSIADMELRTGRRYWNDNNLLRCDYRLMKAEETDLLDVLTDFLHPLSEKVQAFALRLHRRYVEIGMTCSLRILGDVNLAYAFIKKGKRELSPTDIYSLSIWQFSYSIRYGYSLVVRPKKTEKYLGVIETFPSALREVIARGYGCDRKLRNERCQQGCQGIRIPLDDSILPISGEIETWLDHEISYSLPKK